MKSIASVLQRKGLGWNSCEHSAGAFIGGAHVAGLLMGAAKIDGKRIMKTGRALTFVPVVMFGICAANQVIWQLGYSHTLFEQ